MQYVKLGEVIHSVKSERCGDGDFPVLSITKGDGIILQSEKFKKRIASQDTSSYKVVRRGQLVQGIHIDEANFGVQDIVNAGIVSPAYKIWDVNDAVIHPKYLEEVLRSPRSIQYYSSNFNGSIKRRERISDKDFLAMDIPCPSLEEQEYVLAVIHKIRYLLLLQQKELLLLNDLIKARFVEMFGWPGTDTKGWGMTCLGDICELNPKKGTDNRLIPNLEVSFVPMTAVSENGSIDASEIKLFDEVKTGFTYFAENDVLFAKITPCMENGKGAVAVGLQNGIGFGSTEFHVLRPLKEISNPQWLYVLTSFEQFRKDAAANMTGSAGQRRVPASFLDKYKVSLPPIALQKQFADFVTQVDKSKFEVQKALDEAQLLFDSLMQKYFG